MSRGEAHFVIKNLFEIRRFRTNSCVCTSRPGPDAPALAPDSHN